MDFAQDIAPSLIALGISAIPVVGGVLSGVALSLMKSRNMDTMWFEAISRAGGYAYRHLAASGKPITDTDAILDAARVGADYLLDRLPEQIAKRELSHTAMAQIVTGELGKLLAQDPTVAPAPAPSIYQLSTGGA
jgi:predicted NAD/FAD-binding protein